MNVIRCKNGHFYDGDSYKLCPHCGEAAMADANKVPEKEAKKSFWGRARKNKEADIPTVDKTPSVISTENFGIGDTPTDVLENNESEKVSAPLLKKNPTLDFWQTSSHSENRTSDMAAEKEENEKTSNFQAEDKFAKADDAGAAVIMQPDMKNEVQSEEAKPKEPSSSLREAVKKASASSEGKTMSYFSSATTSSSAQTQNRKTSEPVVGWLVCIGGCHFGECFNIYAGKNSIGRSEENRIAVFDDNSISRIKHALIVYEPKKRNFYLQPGDSSGLTYLNEDYITDSHKLTVQDIIELGDSKFMFVPLCGETFSWEEHISKGE